MKIKTWTAYAAMLIIPFVVGGIVLAIKGMVGVPLAVVLTISTSFFMCASVEIWNRHEHFNKRGKMK